MINCSWCRVILSLFLVRGRLLISVCMRKEVLPTGIDHDPVPDPEVAILLTITEDLPLRATSRPHAMLCHGIAHLREDTFRHTTAHHLVIIGRKSHHLEELDDYFFVVCFCNSTFYFFFVFVLFFKNLRPPHSTHHFYFLIKNIPWSGTPEQPAPPHSLVFRGSFFVC